MAQRGRPRKNPPKEVKKEETNNQNNQQAQDFSFEEFAKGLNNPMVTDMMNKGLFSPQMLNSLLKWADGMPYQYSRDNIIELLKDPVKNEKAIRQMHLYFYYNNLFYKRTISYFASMFTYKYNLIPLVLDVSEINTASFKRSYAKAKKWAFKFNEADEFRKVTETCIGEDVGYYYIIENQDTIHLQKLPSDWCMITGRTNYGYTFKFNLMYFMRYGITEIENYPPEIVNEWMRLMNDDPEIFKREPFLWMDINPENSVVFKFNENVATILPVFLGLFLDLIEIVEFKQLIKSKAQLEAIQLIFQKIPLKNEKDSSANKDPMLINASLAGKFHQSIKTSLPDSGLGLYRVITSPCDVSTISLKDSNNKNDLVGVAEQSYFNSAGISQLLFNSEGQSGMALLKSIMADESFIFHILRQYERFMTREINKSTGKFRFKVDMPNLTVYNTDDKLTSYITAGQNGIPNKSKILNASGINQLEAENISAFEKFLGFDEWQPLSSSYTQSGNDKGGAPSKGDKVSDSTIVGQEAESNINRNLGNK
jgi:hypothetical protein